ncbi:MAG: pyridoxamine 5'-phosphate oxidase family protein [Chloroflexota bacterium]
MTVLQSNPDLHQALQGEMTPKFLATRNADGLPNVVPIISLRAADDQPDVVFFGNFLLRKSIENLKHDRRVAILVITPDLNGWILRGDFLEFQRTGRYVEHQMAGPLLRYNAYTGIRNAGLIQLRELEAAFHIPRLQVLLDYLQARLAALAGTAQVEGEVRVPRPVRREFGRMAAVKVLAWVGEDGHPKIVPSLSLQPLGSTALVCRRPGRLPGPPAGAAVASNLLTFEAVSYQAKGRWVERGGAGVIRVSEVYAGGPPLPGGRIA